LHTVVQPGNVRPTPLMSLPIGLPTRHRLQYAALGAVLAAAAACGYATNPKPTINVVTDTLVAFAINGTLAVQPSAFDLFTDRVVLADQNLAFDIAFDIDSATQQAIIYPPKLLSNSFITPRHVGLQRLTVPFDSVHFGFRRGYVFDSSFAVTAGQGVMVVTNPVACAADANPSLYGKGVVASVNTTDRTIHFRATVDPNCGFRSFYPGIPAF
jgi:hypothetical protein